MSIFLELLEDNLPTISPLLMEVLLRELPQCAEKEMSDEDTMCYVVVAYQTVLGKPITTTQAREIILHLLEGNEQGESKAEEAASDNKRSFGSSFYKHIAEMELDDYCLVLAGYDNEKAAALYRYTDYRMVKAMRKTWQDLEAHKSQLMLEAAVYGFGGGFGESSVGSEADEHYDLRSDDLNAADLNKLLNTWH